MELDVFAASDSYVRRTVRRITPARFRLMARSLENYCRYGPGYPRAMEPLEVPARSVRRAISNPMEVCAVGDGAKAWRSYRKALGSRGRVVGTDDFADFVVVPLERLVKYRCCVAHWRDGVGWEQTGIFDHMLRKIEEAGPQSGCVTVDDLRRRYARLDRIFDQVKRDGRLRHAHELDGPVAEGIVWHGIELHVGPEGEPIFGDSGTHRLAMAHVLGLRRIPALLGFVHESALSHLPRLRHGASALLPALSSWTWMAAAI